MKSFAALLLFASLAIASPLAGVERSQQPFGTLEPQQSLSVTGVDLDLHAERTLEFEDGSRYTATELEKVALCGLTSSEVCANTRPDRPQVQGCQVLRRVMLHLCDLRVAQHVRQIRDAELGRLSTPR